MKKILNLTFLIIVMLLINVGCSSSTNLLINDLNHTETITANGFMLSMVENTNNEVTNMSFEIIYYDVDKNILGNEIHELVAVKPNSLIPVYFNIEEGYDSYEFKINVESSYEENKIDSLSIKDNDTNDQTVVTITNNSDTDLSDLEFYVVYYNDSDEIVGFNWEHDYNIKQGIAKTYESVHPYDEDYESLGFSKYKIFITQAY